MISPSQGQKGTPIPNGNFISGFTVSSNCCQPGAQTDPQRQAPHSQVLPHPRTEPLVKPFSTQTEKRQQEKWAVLLNTAQTGDAL